MNIKQIINKKENKKKLTKDEIYFFVNNYTNGNIGDQNMTKLLKAICKNSMNKNETYHLTKAMQNSGKTLDLSMIKGVCADKHSSGGVSDTTTIILAPIVACCGVNMLKSSGAALGFTGGTKDKLESFEGYKTEQTFSKAVELVKKNGACLITQSEELAPADKKIYALRDITDTVESLPLIVSSIVSKKLASGNDVYVFDVKCGDGAFMKTKKQAIALAKKMVNIIKHDGKKAVAIITDMSQPLGYNIGDKLEVCEALEVLEGKDNNLAYVSKYLSAKIIELSLGLSFKEAMDKVENCIKNKSAYNKFKQMVLDSDGSIEMFEKRYKPQTVQITAKEEGFIKAYHTKQIGLLSVELGCGRKTKNQKIDHNAGIITHFKIGDKVEKGDVIFEVVKNQKVSNEILAQLEKCAIISKHKTKKPKLILKIIG